MIKGMHGMFWSTDAPATRAFLRDVFGLPATDAGEGWLIFDIDKADLGVHPADAPGFNISFFCDDLETTKKELEAKGAIFKQPIVDQGFGWVTMLEAPGGLDIQLYQPKY
jgi:predicted enzyme related to lactoylglutathione lyase